MEKYTFAQMLDIIDDSLIKPLTRDPLDQSPVRVLRYYHFGVNRTPVWANSTVSMLHPCYCWKCECTETSKRILFENDGVWDG